MNYLPVLFAALLFSYRSLAQLLFRNMKIVLCEALWWIVSSEKCSVWLYGGSCLQNSAL